MRVGCDGVAGGGVGGSGLAAMAPFLLGVRERREVELARMEALAACGDAARHDRGGSRTERSGRRHSTCGAGTDPAVNTLAASPSVNPCHQRSAVSPPEVADPVADLIVAALVIADERQAQHLTELLAGIADSARQQAAMRVETGRARTYTSSRLPRSDHARSGRRAGGVLAGLHGALRTRSAARWY